MQPWCEAWVALIALCAAALCGLAVGDVARLDPSRLAFGALLALVGAALTWRRSRWRWIALLTCAAALGALRATLAAPADNQSALDPYLGLAVSVRGEVVQPPTTSAAAAQLQLNVRAVGPAGREPSPAEPASPALAEPASPAPARLRVVGDPGKLGAVEPGTTLALEGRLLADDSQRAGTALSQPTLLFPNVLETQPPLASTHQPAALVYGLRSATERNIRAHLPDPQAGLAIGVLLGGSAGLDADFRLQLQRSGLSHLVAIDGFKQVIVAAALGGVAARACGPRLAILPVGFGIVAYTLVTGAHPSAVRAALMLGLSTLASLTGRIADPLTSVLVAAVVMAGLEPRILLDVGLQLSLSAVLGIVLLWPRWRRRLRRVPRFVAEPAGLTLAVTLATLPVALSVFQSVSLVSPLAHILAVPLLAPVLAGTALLAIVASVPLLGVSVAWLTWLPTTALVAVIRVSGSLPGAALSTGRPPPLATAGMAVALLAWGGLGLPEAARLHAAWEDYRTRSAASLTPIACLTACLVAIGLLKAVQPDGRLHVQALDAGRGDAVFIRGPTGRTLLVVGGRIDAALVAAQVAEHLAVWEHSLDGVVRLDPAAEAGLSLTLARYPPAQRLDVDADARIDLGGGAALDVYAASPAVTAAEPGVTAAEPGVTAAEPGVTAAEAGVTAAEAGVTAAEAGVTSSARGVTGSARSVTTQASSVTTSASSVTAPAPSVTALAPTVTAPAPTVTTAAPSVTAPAPGVTGSTSAVTASNGRPPPIAPSGSAPRSTPSGPITDPLSNGTARQSSLNASIAQTVPAASISFGSVWLPLIGHPPPAALGDPSDVRALVADGAPFAELVSDGATVWLAISGTEALDRYTPVSTPVGAPT
jgi:ComEC/Rec2-related protein